MVREHRRQQLRVVLDGVEHVERQLGEGVVGRGEHRERTAAKGLDQAGVVGETGELGEDGPGQRGPDDVGHLRVTHGVALGGGRRGGGGVGRGPGGRLGRGSGGGLDRGIVPVGPTGGAGERDAGEDGSEAPARAYGAGM